VAGNSGQSPRRNSPGPSRPADRPTRPISAQRRIQARRRIPSSTIAVIVLLGLGITLLAIVLAQATIGFQAFGPGAVVPPPRERPAAATLAAVARPVRPVLDAQSPDVARDEPPGAKELVADPALAAIVQQQLGEQRGLFGVAIKDLDTGQGVLVQADREFPAASLFKLLVLYEVYRQRDLGRLSFTERLTLSENYTRHDLGTLDVAPGTAVTVAWAVERMITRSDNATANLLVDKVGVASVNDTMRELGMRESQISGQKLSTSARDMLLLLETLALGRQPSQAAAVEMVQLLLDQRINDRLPSQLPRDTPVAHKTGNLDGIAHDVGIVYSPNATFVIVLLAEQVANVAQVSQAEGALTRAVYDHFNGAGTLRPRSALRAPNPAARATAVPPNGTVVAGGATSAPLSAAATPLPTVALVGTPGRGDAPTVEPTRAVTAVRPTAAPGSTPLPTAGGTAAQSAGGETTAGAAPTAVRPTAVPPTAALPPPTEPARGPLPPTVAPTAAAVAAPTAVPAPTTAPAPTAAPPTAVSPPAARLPEAPRFGPPTPLAP
jgi:beta-lactamase class A